MSFNFIFFNHPAHKKKNHMTHMARARIGFNVRAKYSFGDATDGSAKPILWVVLFAIYSKYNKKLIRATHTPLERDFYYHFFFFFCFYISFACNFTILTAYTHDIFFSGGINFGRCVNIKQFCYFISKLRSRWCSARRKSFIVKDGARGVAACVYI